MPKKIGPPEKKFASYLFDDESPKTSLDDYIKHPATSLLTYLVEAHNAMAMCKNKFKKTSSGDFNQDSRDTLRVISAALLATVLGHFETFERCLFAGVFEGSRHFDRLDLKELFRGLGKDHSVDVERLAAHRGVPASVGVVLADSLSGWHDPKKVNGYFKAFQLPVDFFSNDDIDELSVLWQMRHSIVHTGAWLTLPDAQKVPALKAWANKPLIFKYTFIQAVCRKLHPLVKRAVHRLETAFRKQLKPGLLPVEAKEIDTLFSVGSINQGWLK